MLTHLMLMSIIMKVFMMLARIHLGLALNDTHFLRGNIRDKGLCIGLIERDFYQLRTYLTGLVLMMAAEHHFILKFFFVAELICIV